MEEALVEVVIWVKVAQMLKLETLMVVFLLVFAVMTVVEMVVVVVIFVVIAQE